MSFDYYAFIKKDNWPTAAMVQEALKSLDLPVTLEHPANDQPFSADWTVSLPVIFEGRPVALEADIEQVSDAEDPDSLFGYIAKSAAPNFKISNGDYALTLTFRTDADEIRAGLCLAAALILKFDGYGFENQFESHGSIDFAQQLLAEAADAAPFEI